MPRVPFSPTAVLADMTTDEKVQLLCGADAWHLHGVPRLGVAGMTLTDGPHGVRLTEAQALSEDTVAATVFPVESAMANSWNPSLLSAIGSAIGREARHLGVGVILGPGLNGKRSPLGGRNFEYFSEDPQLTAELATAYVSGMQEQGVGACIKHFVGNEQETRRFLINAEIDERTLQELYVFPFAQVIRRASPWTIMGAYNGVNGTYACQNPDILQRILREQLGFTGLVMSDWSAVQDKEAAHSAGLDLEMPGPQERDNELLSAIAGGRVSEETLDQRALQVLNLLARVQSCPSADVPVDWDSHHELAVRAATEGLVLLRNEQSALPFRTSQSLAVIGHFAQVPRFQGGGSSHMNPRELDVPLSALCRRWGEGNISYRPGYHGVEVTDELIADAVEAAREADQVVLFTGTTDSMESEGFDRADMKLAPGHLRLIEAVSAVNNRVAVVLHAGSAMEICQFETDVQAILLAGLGGEGGGEAIARVLAGEVSPSGRLAESWPVRLEHNPTYETFPGSKTTVAYQEGLFTGYRYYDSKVLPVQYPFGFGLSYSRFEYIDPEVSVHAGTEPGLVGGRVVVTVTNSGSTAAADVVQVYIHDRESTCRRPVHELKGFAKTRTLEPGESERVEVPLDDYAFAYYVPHLGRFAAESGAFDIEIGASSRDIRLRETVHVTSDIEVRIHPTLNDTVQEWLDDSRTRPLMQDILDEISMHEGHLMYAIVLGFPIPTLIKGLGWMGYDRATAERVYQRLAAAVPASSG